MQTCSQRSQRSQRFTVNCSASPQRLGDQMPSGCVSTDESENICSYAFLPTLALPTLVLIPHSHGCFHHSPPQKMRGHHQSSPLLCSFLTLTDAFITAHLKK